jgi:hypothetical protein
LILFRQHAPHYFDQDRENYLPMEHLDPEEKQKAVALRQSFRKNLLELHYLLYRVEKTGLSLAGWSCGSQMDHETFYMRNSVVFEQDRRIGLYTKMAEQMIEDLTEQGFLKIKSSHVASNNPILIAKLRLGFKIQGFEINEKNGVIANLCYFTKSHGQQVYEFRVGALKRS